MMTTYTECAMKQEFLNSWNSYGRDCDKMRAPYLYISVTRVSSSEEPSRVHYAK